MSLEKTMIFIPLQPARMSDKRGEGRRQRAKRGEDGRNGQEEQDGRRECSDSDEEEKMVSDMMKVIQSLKDSGYVVLQTSNACSKAEEWECSHYSLTTYY